MLSRCDICQKDFDSDYLLTIKGYKACSDCKPKLVQSIQEGVGIIGEHRSDVPLKRLKPAFMTEGELLYGPRRCTLPKRCVVCNEKVDTEIIETHLQWQPMGDAFIFLPDQHAFVSYYLCFRHGKLRNTITKLSKISLMILVFPLAFSIYLYIAEYDLLFLVTLFFVILPLLALGLISEKDYRLKASSMDEHGVWIKGVGGPFLDSFNSTEKAKKS